MSIYHRHIQKLNHPPAAQTRTVCLKGWIAILLIAFFLVSPWNTARVLAAGTSATANSANSSAAAASQPTTTANATASAPAPASANSTAPLQTSLLDPAAANALDINAKAYVLYDAQSGVFLLGRNPDKPLSPASITKVMTVLLALEKLKLTDVITITKDMFATIPNDYVRLGLMEGETISVEETLYACMLISANDAAMALALKISGSVGDFAAMMNARAKELGCTSTTFTNPYGLAEASNLTTAHDMALMLAHVLKNETYVKMSTTKSHLIPATNKYGTRGLTNGNRFVSNANYAYVPYIGGKTGFTNMSGHTIVAGARKEGRTLVGVILGATASDIRYANLVTLFNYSFSTYANAALDPSAYEAASSQTVAKLESQIKDAGLGFTIAKTEMKLSPFTTATRARNAAGFTCCIGDGPATIPSDTASPVISYPLLVEFKDGTKNQVGTLSLTLQQTPKATKSPSSSTAGQTGQSGQTSDSGLAGLFGSNGTPGDKPSTGTILLWIGGIVLAGLLIFALVVFIMARRELKRRRRRRSRPL